MQMPSNANPSAVSDLGASLHALYNAAVQTSQNPTVVLDEELANLAQFRQYGNWDYQRVGPNQTTVSAFVDYANFEIGAYAASIQMPLSEILTIANNYAGANSNFGLVEMNPIYSNLPKTKVYDISTGYEYYQQGLIGHH